MTPSELERVLVWQPPRLEGWLLSAPSEEVSEPEREPRREEAEELLAGERAVLRVGMQLDCPVGASRPMRMRGSHATKNLSTSDKLFFQQIFVLK